MDQPFLTEIFRGFGNVLYNLSMTKVDVKSFVLNQLHRADRLKQKSMVH